MKIQKEIAALKADLKAVILAHNYQPDEIQEIGDFVGDSLELSRKAAQTPAELIVFCGVHFMAETAKILSPQKMVLLPDPEAGCPLADTLNEAQLAELKARHPKAKVVTYVNSSAAIKAMSDICCTSANAEKVVASLGEEGDGGEVEVIFVPDQNLGKYVASRLKKELILSTGYCPIHHNLLPEEVIACKVKNPQALFLAHPECRPEVLALADFVGSTSQMLNFVKNSAQMQFMIGTEKGLLYRLKKENPERSFILPSAKLFCPNMKKTSLEKVLTALKEQKFQIEVPPEISKKARQAIQSMLSLP